MKNTAQTLTTLQENIDFFEEEILGGKLSQRERIIFETAYSFGRMDSKKPDFPKMLSSKQVAEVLGIQRTSMAQKRKVKSFPAPIVVVDGFPLWLESDIVAWKEARVK